MLCSGEGCWSLRRYLQLSNREPFHVFVDSDAYRNPSIDSYCPFLSQTSLAIFVDRDILGAGKEQPALSPSGATIGHARRALGHTYALALDVLDYPLLLRLMLWGRLHHFG